MLSLFLLLRFSFSPSSCLTFAYRMISSSLRSATFFWASLSFCLSLASWSYRISISSSFSWSNSLGTFCSFCLDSSSSSNFVSSLSSFTSSSSPNLYSYCISSSSSYSFWRAVISSISSSLGRLPPSSMIMFSSALTLHF